MRLWSLDPSYLDAKGLVAAWREALLAQKVLAGATHGYRQHPQLIRFRQSEAPRAALSAFLRGIHREATSRGYRFDVEKIVKGPLLSGETELTQPGPDWVDLSEPSAEASPTGNSDGEAEPQVLPPASGNTSISDASRTVPAIPVTQGQLDYEAELLTFKLRMRAPKLVGRLESDLRNATLKNHPLFRVIPGDIEPWEKVRDDL
ncbi:pyrimidine dimer DNA glycosylase/endonuclease V [Rothia uropygialis]|uniref:pyrimidine dimer DNA glycosylase/endonuclease V n=1 Tax=Kocuria sp. 36 TaxID=1415402 RepID=UPI00101CFCE1|nr:pyrimidine dimer DNA glycosylase/endonuclease V [Kocuria sp. 36]